MSGISLEHIKEHYNFELARKAEINSAFKTNIQLALTAIGFLYFFGTTDHSGNLWLSLAYWLSLFLASTSIALSGIGSVHFSTRFPDSPNTIDDYYQKLREYDVETADEGIERYLEERWIENSSINAQRNRQRSSLAYYSRLSLFAMAFPLVVILVMSSKVRFPI